MVLTNVKHDRKLNQKMVKSKRQRWYSIEESANWLGGVVIILAIWWFSINSINWAGKHKILAGLIVLAIIVLIGTIIIFRRNIWRWINSRINSIL